jgi:hypothetical protein
MEFARINRRRLLYSSAMAGAISGVGASSFAGGTTPTPEISAAQDESDTVSVAEAPAWSFTLIVFLDPYEGEIQDPVEVDAGSRVVGAQVAVDNGSDQALNFFIGDIRLRDTAGMEFRAGTARGAEPRIGSRNLLPGERSRGWTWFLVPTDSELVQLTYIAPAPEFRIDLDRP